MPDWTYQTVFRPLLFRLRPAQARDFTLGVMGRLAALPFGPHLIDFLGHMRPPTALRRQVCGLPFPSPVGLEAGLDRRALGLRALARFGFGFLEAGPVTEAPVSAPDAVRRLPEQEAVWYPDLPVNDGVDALEARLRQAGPLGIPLGVRLSHRPGAPAAGAAAERCRLMARLAPIASFFSLEVRDGPGFVPWSADEWAAHLTAVLDCARSLGRPAFLCLPPDLDRERLAWLAKLAPAHGAGGVILGGGVRAADGGRLDGRPVFPRSLEAVGYLRQGLGLDLPVIASGVHEPGEALALLEAGATGVLVHAGLVYSGPGLPKRINETLLAVRAPAAADAPAAAPATATSAPAPNTRVRPTAPSPAASPPPATARPSAGWAWAALLGAAMVIGGLLALLIAVTRVVLPYDEAFVGLTRAQLAALNPNLLAFMAHDRISLSGTMAAIGVLYLYLAYYPLRAGQHWARKALLLSGVVGFATFFVTLGHGYVDPLHLTVTLLLLPFFLLAMARSRDCTATPAALDLANDRAWRAALWGQLLLVALGAAIMVAGLTISAIGMTSVFVPEDLAFLRATPEALQAANPRLVPLIAHDRAGFGGALVCNGLTVLLMALWGFRRGARWLWWAMLAAGAPSYLAALWTHLDIGYTDFIHLLPVYVGMGALALALLLSRPYLCRPVPSDVPARRSTAGSGSAPAAGVGTK